MTQGPGRIPNRVNRIIRIGTRKSKLALWQSNWVKGRLESLYLGLKVELVKITTTGDKILDSPLSKIGGKGLFVKEIENALLRGDVDIAVHSMEDLPAHLPDGLMLCSFPKREDPRDALISRHKGGLSHLRPNAKVGTSSLRRAAQLLHLRPDLRIEALRGNVDTRIRKLDQGEFDAIVLAGAGLKRLGFAERITEYMGLDRIIPAIGQGVLGLEVRAEDREIASLLAPLNEPSTEVAVRAERAFLRELEGGCQVPLAAHAKVSNGRVALEGMVAELDGSRMIRDKKVGEYQDAERIGVELARDLLERGAKEILERIYKETRLPRNS